MADQAMAYLYGRLFAAVPGLRALFPPAMNAQRELLFQAITRVAWTLDSPDGLAARLKRLGRAHRKYGVLPEHYPAFGEALLATVRRFAAEVWTPETEAAWVSACTTAIELMSEGARADDGPAWWPAEVVDHDIRTPDIAVITLRPAQELPFRAGQYVEVQTPRWPRVWRAYSIANAPRPDGTVRLHVRTVPGGWVSTALTRHTRVGDTLLLGPPSGGVPLPDGEHDILAVADDTGLAPLKAIIEHVIASGLRPRVCLVHGARTAAELYDIPDLVRMQSAWPWLRVVPVVSDQQGYEGERGTPPDVLPRLGSWRDHVAYVCGPSPMVEATVRVLQQEGVPPERIHRPGMPSDSWDAYP
ncbi:globin domain-containing protein [Thermostaphylospora chromogena]|uniref:globin domain-containing protein n=1 Tax=Thermostaphylospora chromogena TaxID=35622 RepID=UPI001F619A17